MKPRTPNQCNSDHQTAARKSGAAIARGARALPRGLFRASRAASRSLAACWASEQGATVLEYIIVFPMMFAIFWGCFQFGVTYATQSMMDNAARDVARLIRIGTLNSKQSTFSSTLVTDICNDLTLSSYNLIPNCTSNIQVYLAAAPSGSPTGLGFTSMSAATLSNNTITQTQAYVYSKYDVLLEIGYPMPWASPFYSGTTMLLSTVAFQTEAY